MPLAQAIAALAEFKGVKRRMELRGEVRGISVYDDFAHHPTAIATTLDGLRRKVGQQRIVAVLEARSATMKMGVHRDTLAPSLAGADAVWMFAPPDLGWDAGAVAKALGAKGNTAPTLDDLLQGLLGSLRAGDQVLIMSNGGFGGLHGKLLEALKSTEQSAGRPECDGQRHPVVSPAHRAFPGGPLPLRIFETRYTDMVRRCMRENVPFGVVLIQEGEEAGEVATTATVGCSARIADFHTLKDGLLGISCVGSAEVPRGPRVARAGWAEHGRGFMARRRAGLAAAARIFTARGDGARGAGRTRRTLRTCGEELRRCRLGGLATHRACCLCAANDKQALLELDDPLCD